MTIHMYTDYSNLNAPYDQYPPRLDVGYSGLGCAGVRGGCSGLGAMVYGHDDVLAKQRALNTALRASGICPLTEDGSLGPKTCGAWMVFDGPSVPSECQSIGFAAVPKPGPCPGGGGGGGGTVTPGTPATPPQVTPVQASMFSGDTMWIIGGLAVAAVAIGGALYMKKKK